MPQVIEKMERETGFEPATSSLGSWHSTTELLPPENSFQVSQILRTPGKRTLYDEHGPAKGGGII
jgi:hypothetical protein